MGIREDDRHQSDAAANVHGGTKVWWSPQPRSGRQAVRGFQGPGVVNYRRRRGINDCKVVVCLDSLYRVVTRKFDTMVVDEAVAVFLHFNSNAEAGRERRAPELIVMQARSTYLVDATLDATFIKNIVDYFCAVKFVTAQWRNRHVRPPTAPPRSRCAKGRFRGIIGEVPRVIRGVKVLDLLTGGKGGVCCSSTKFTEVEEFIAERKPDAV
jgi:hypothetical protein